MTIQQSVCFPMMQPLPAPMDTFLARVAEIGFAAVEIWAPDADFPRLAEMAGRHGLRIASMVGHASLPVGFNNPGEYARIIAELRESIDLAAQYGVPGLICFSGNRRAGQTDAEGVQACVEGLRQIAGYAEQKGVNLNMELLNSKIDHPGYQCDHAAWGLEVVKRVNSPRVKLLYDIYHMQIMEGDLINTIRDNIAWIGHFHTAGVPGRANLDDQQEINYRGVCRTIQAAGYDLYLGHEFRPKGELFAALEQAYQTCTGV
jgi:hydroxypyruvate isomerase